jgi:hypothetical protein
MASTMPVPYVCDIYAIEVEEYAQDGQGSISDWGFKLFSSAHPEWHSHKLLGNKV